MGFVHLQEATVQKWKTKDFDRYPGFVVIDKDIPAKYWESYNSAWSVGEVGYEPHDKMVKAGEAYGPDDGHPEGGITRTGRRGNNYAWVPVEFFEPDVNEFGEVAP